MKKIICITCVLALFSSAAMAARPMDKENKSSGKRETYRSTTGTHYQYDLSKPVDRMKYENDQSAQIRDEIYRPITPEAEIDKGLGQRGGGLIRD